MSAENVARGLKAAINNPRVSDEAKERDAQRLQEMGEEVPAGYSTQHAEGGEALSQQQKAGYISALKRDNVSAEAKQHARDMLGQEGGESHSAGGEGLSQQQKAGYTSVLKRDDVSDEAKQHAREMLNEV
ncbi:hypothetical protein BKA70DRAFT_1271025 [Coprinopsis sp. MPI-PUGE-AT-0042]|nr:hypothetical protein BKA70DRAFT_1271025 [Coprinopsis sp. MPI-PUGE-AT-0042]